jgi:hypothetical protein
MTRAPAFCRAFAPDITGVLIVAALVGIFLA